MNLLSIERYISRRSHIVSTGGCVASSQPLASAPLTANWWSDGARTALAKHRFGSELTFEGRGPRPGQFVRLPHLARTLRLFAEAGKDPFYTGLIAERIVKTVSDEGGVLSMDDLAEHESEWVEPISIDYRGSMVWECPPNGQGLAALIALNIARSFDMATYPSGGPQRYHLLVECMRLGLADAAWYVSDPAFVPVPVQELLSRQYGEVRSTLIRMDSTNHAPVPGLKSTRGEDTGRASIRPNGDTVYFSVVDRHGNGCSFINSTYLNFGSGIVPQGCGYSLQNRGLCFRYERGHPNSLMPRKRPYHTIMPGLITDAKSGDLRSVFGVMGGMMQPQGHLQVASALIDDESDPQAALDRGRFQLVGGEAGGGLFIEDSVAAETLDGLRSRGQSVTIITGQDRAVFGLAQVIQADNAGVFWCGSDPRGDGCAIGLA